MRKYNNDQNNIICEYCGSTEINFERRNIKIGTNNDIIIPNILVSTCSSCQNIVNIPRHSGLIIKKALHT